MKPIAYSPIRGCLIMATSLKACVFWSATIKLQQYAQVKRKEKVKQQQIGAEEKLLDEMAALICLEAL